MIDLKRIGDLALAIVLIVPVALVVLIAALMVRIETRGSPLFLQRRVGRNEQAFTLLKLRTMRTGTPEDASHLVGTSTVTRVGRFLRRTKIDELPQVWSILTGAMSFVGPRPCLTTQTLLIEARRSLGVFSVRPGITGLAQVQGIDMSQPALLAETDARYIKTRSFGGDCLLMVKTLSGSGFYDAAHREQKPN